MNLHVEQFGFGPDLVLLHGWGLHGGVFAALAERLAPRYRISLIDLPGHGRSPPLTENVDLAAVTEAVAAAAPPRAIWLGWSLGGMIATQMALHAPARVDKLILVASSPRFITAPEWPHAMDPAVLAGFARALEQDYRATLERFLSLQVATGTAESRETLRSLRTALLQYTPALPALRAGLEILRTADLRLQFATLSRPTQLILGGRDMLVPVSVGTAMRRHAPAIQVDVLDAAGHAPFLSHPQEFLATLTGFLEHPHDG